MFGANFINAKMIEYVLKIELEDGVIVRGDYFGNYEGVLRPMLEWETKLIQ
jgi:hypothetical protein